jgi:hypothetical protein
MSTCETTRICTIVLATDGRPEPCSGERCAYWEQGCVFDGVGPDLVAYPEVAALVLRVRRELEQIRGDKCRPENDVAAASFRRRLAAGRE